MKAPLLFIFFLITILSATAQYKKKFTELFEEGAGWTPNGWLYSAGVTYNWSPKGEKLNQVIHPNLTGDIRPLSAPGISAEIGRFHLVPSGLVFNNVDYSLAFKQLKFKQDLSANYTSPMNDSTGLVNDAAKRVENNITLNFNLNSIIQFSEFQWIQPSLGIHGDYIFGSKSSSRLDTAVSRYVVNDEKWNLQLHAKIAYGAKLTSELFIVPSIEVGLWRLLNLDDINTGKMVFHSKYIPVIFSVKFLLQRPLSMRPCDVEVDEVDLTKTKRRKKKVRLF